MGGIGCRFPAFLREAERWL